MGIQACGDESGIAVPIAVMVCGTWFLHAIPGGAYLGAPDRAPQCTIQVDETMDSLPGVRRLDVDRP